MRAVTGLAEGSTARQAAACATRRSGTQRAPRRNPGRAAILAVPPVGTKPSEAVTAMKGKVMAGMNAYIAAHNLRSDEGEARPRAQGCCRPRTRSPWARTILAQPRPVGPAQSRPVRRARAKRLHRAASTSSVGRQRPNPRHMLDRPAAPRRRYAPPRPDPAPPRPAPRPPHPLSGPVGGRRRRRGRGRQTCHGRAQAGRRRRQEAQGPRLTPCRAAGAPPRVLLLRHAAATRHPAGGA